jgi:hypothetical protein
VVILRPHGYFLAPSVMEKKGFSVRHTSSSLNVRTQLLPIVFLSCHDLWITCLLSRDTGGTLSFEMLDHPSPTLPNLYNRTDLVILYHLGFSSLYTKRHHGAVSRLASPKAPTRRSLLEGIIFRCNPTEGLSSWYLSLHLISWELSL